MESKEEVHWLSWTWEVLCDVVLDIPSANVPGIRSGDPKDCAINLGELGPLEIWPIDIEGVLFPSVLESEELSRTSSILVWVDVSGDIGCDLNGFGDVGVGGLVGVIV